MPCELMLIPLQVHSNQSKHYIKFEKDIFLGLRIVEKDLMKLITTIG